MATTASTTVGKPTLTYFNSVGRAEVPRLLLEDAGVDYDHIPLADYATWLSRKDQFLRTGKLAFGQLPLYEEPGLVLVQSGAITRHLARKHGYAGAGDTEAALIDQANEGVQEVFDRLTQVLVFTPAAEVEAAKAAFVRDYLPVRLDHFARLLAANGDNGRLVGSGGAAGLSYADLNLWVTLTTAAERVESSPALIEARPNIKAFLDGVSSRDRIRAYLARDVYNKNKAS